MVVKRLGYIIAYVYCYNVGPRTNHSRVKLLRTISSVIKKSKAAKPKFAGNGAGEGDDEVRDNSHTMYIVQPVAIAMYKSAYMVALSLIGSGNSFVTL